MEINCFKVTLAMVPILTGIQVNGCPVAPKQVEFQMGIAQNGCSVAPKQVEFQMGIAQNGCPVTPKQVEFQMGVAQLVIVIIHHSKVALPIKLKVLNSSLLRYLFIYSELLILICIVFLDTFLLIDHYLSISQQCAI